MLRVSRAVRVGTPARVAPRVRSRRPVAPRAAAVDVSRLAAGDLPDELTAPLPWDAAFADLFLRHYWQRRPLVIRQAVPGFQSPLSADELAGLACEVPSRIVLQQGGVRPWELRRGPFVDADFESLPETHWTLLVNGVDRAVPAVADELLSLLTFLPKWRLDDIQVSYAPAHGSVGAHSDQYDVMLLQADGRKAWSVSQDPRYHPLNAAAFTPGLDVAVLSDFVAEKSFVLEAGDMLYLPPAVAHHGVALEPGFTYSVGFLAPTRRELFLSWAAAFAEADPRATERWTDPWLTPATRPGQLSVDAVDAAVALIDSLPRSRADVAAWFGCHVTTPRGGQELMPLAERPAWEWIVVQGVDAGELCRHESSRFAYLPSLQAPGGGTLFADGRCFEAASAAAAAVAAEFADRRVVPWPQLLALVNDDVEARSLLQTLLELGLLFAPSDEDADDEPDDADDDRVEEIDLDDETPV